MTKSYIYKVKQPDGSILFICHVGENYTQDINELVNLDDYVLCGVDSILCFQAFIVSVLFNSIQNTLKARQDRRLRHSMLHGADQQLEFQTGQQTVRYILTTLRYNVNRAPTHNQAQTDIHYWLCPNGNPTTDSPFVNQTMITNIQASLPSNELIIQHQGQAEYLTIEDTLKALFEELNTVLNLNAAGHNWVPFSSAEFMQQESTPNLFNYLTQAKKQTNGNFENLVNYLLRVPATQQTGNPNGFDVLYQLRDLARVAQGSSEPTSENTPVLALIAKYTGNQVTTYHQFVHFDYEGWANRNPRQAQKLGQELRKYHKMNPTEAAQMPDLVAHHPIVRQKIQTYILERSQPNVPYLSTQALVGHGFSIFVIFGLRELLIRRTVRGRNVAVQPTPPVQRFPPFPPFPDFPNEHLTQVMEDIRRRFHDMSWEDVKRAMAMLGWTYVGGMTATHPVFLPVFVRVANVVYPGYRQALINLFKAILKNLTKKP